MLPQPGSWPQKILLQAHSCGCWRPRVLAGCQVEDLFPGAAVTSYHKLDSFKRTGIYSLTVLRTRKSRVRMSAGPCPLRGAGGTDPSSPFSRLPAAAVLLRILGSRRRNSRFCLHMAFCPLLRLCVLIIRTLAIGSGPTLTHHDHIGT